MGSEIVKRLRGRAGMAQRKRRMDRTNWLCEHCLAEGRTQPATIVNHKVPLAQGGSDDDDNTENLCRPCDRIVTAKQFGQQAPIEARGVGRNGRPTSPDHAWNSRPTPYAKV